MRILAALAKDLQERGGLDMSRCTRDGTIVINRKHGSLKISVDPRWQGTWQISTAFALLSPIIANQLDRLH
jgi:hypothetical protein